MKAREAAVAAGGAVNASDAAAALHDAYDNLHTALPMPGDSTAASAGRASADSVRRRRLLLHRSGVPWAGVTLTELVRQGLDACIRALRPFSWQYSFISSRTTGLAPSATATAGDGCGDRVDRGFSRAVLAAGQGITDSATAASVAVGNGRQGSLAVDSSAALAGATQRSGGTVSAVNSLVSVKPLTAGAALPDSNGETEGSASGMSPTAITGPDPTRTKQRILTARILNFDSTRYTHRPDQP